MVTTPSSSLGVTNAPLAGPGHVLLVVMGVLSSWGTGAIGTRLVTEMRPGPDGRHILAMKPFPTGKDLLQIHARSSAMLV